MFLNCWPWRGWSIFILLEDGSFLLRLAWPKKASITINPVSKYFNFFIFLCCFMLWSWFALRDCPIWIVAMSKDLLTWLSAPRLPLWDGFGSLLTDTRAICQNRSLGRDRCSVDSYHGSSHYYWRQQRSRWARQWGRSTVQLIGCACFRPRFLILQLPFRLL